MTLEQAVELVDKTAKENVHEVRYHETMAINEAARQGDIYIMRVEDNYAHGKIWKKRQIVDGNTQGSRHVIEAGPMVFAPNFDAAPSDLFAETANKLNVSQSSLINALYGPSIKSPERFTITHPEHAHESLPAGCYITWSQLDPRTMQRVKD